MADFDVFVPAPVFRPTMIGSFAAVRQRTQVVAVDTETQTHWEEDGDRFTPGAAANGLRASSQNTRVIAADTLTHTRWEAQPGANTVYQDDSYVATPSPRWQPAPRPVRRHVPAPAAIAPRCQPAPAPAPLPDTSGDRLREELEVFLDNRDNRDAGASRHVLATSPKHVEAGSPEQKARLIKNLIDGNPGREDRDATLRILAMAGERGELGAVIQALSLKDKMKDLMCDMGDNDAGREMAALFMAHGLYANPLVYRAMDDDAAVSLVESLGFKRPMIGTNDALRALPEAAKHRMIRELNSGNVTHTEYAMARWINLHCEIPARI